MATNGDEAPDTGEGCDDLPILHVDMDAFYVEVERKRDPSLNGRPVIVGGAGRRGVVASASYEARASGVHSAMPTAQARRLCPASVVISSDFSSYIEASEAIADVFESVTPNVEPISLDEAFLDVSGAHRLFGTSPQIAWHLRGAVRESVGLDCSVGVASTKTLAKLASEAAKPVVGLDGPLPGMGVRVVPVSQQIEFLWAHPVQALWGVGPATLRRLETLGIATVGDLAQVPVKLLVTRVGSVHGAHLADLARGIDARPVQPGGVAKSIGHEETFEFDVTDAEVIRSEAVRLADAVASRLRANGLAGRTVTVKVRHPDFSLRTRSTTLAVPVQTPRTLARTAHRLVAKLDIPDGIRLLGIAVSNLAPSGSESAAAVSPADLPAAASPTPGIPEQLELTLGDASHSPNSAASGTRGQSGLGAAPEADADRKLAEALDRIRGRFGRAVIAHGAAALGEGAPGERRWGR